MTPQRIRSHIKFAVSLAILANATLAPAQSGRKLLHEYVRFDAAALQMAGAMSLPPTDATEGAEGGQLETGEPDLPRYGALGLATSGDDSDNSRLNGPGSPESQVRLDTSTGPSGDLQYFEVFDPATGPWKRSSARDSVVAGSGGQDLRVQDPTLDPFALGGAQDAWTRYRATFQAELISGRATPIPSVSPQMAILSVETDPPANVSFFKDSADNYFAQSNAAGVFTLKMELAAPAAYFEQIPAMVSSVPAPDADALGPQMAGAVQQVLAAAHVNPQGTVSDAVSVLTEYFRGFAAEDRPSDLANPSRFLEIALGRVGVCRHRAHAFTVTALALGIPTRYVFNEAHAFVEVKLDDYWRRIDLGGAARSVTVHGDTAAAGSTGTPTATDGADGSESNGITRRFAFAGEVRNSRGSGPSETEVDAFEATPEPQPSAEPTRSQAARQLGRAFGAIAETRISSLAAPQQSARGQQIPITGALETVDLENGSVTPLAGKTVVAFAVPSVGDELRLGDALTAADGSFVIQASLPREFPVGLASVYVVFEGDDTAPACAAE